MPTSTKYQRKQLEDTIREARKVAEKGARETLGALAVDQKEPFKHMKNDRKQCDLRTRLRAHGRALGDQRHPNGGQEMDDLVHATAYEHWHRMLFARFLAENGCLLEPDSRVAVSLSEVEELAYEENADLWELAGRYAERMLPQIFRSDDPVLELALPAETRQSLKNLLDGLPTEIFQADDTFGWVYQYWQTDAKETANESGEKITAETLPAVTQLFTEDYMVDFLLHNTLGAWWVARASSSSGSSSSGSPISSRLAFLRVAGASSSSKSKDVAGPSRSSIQKEQEQDAPATSWGARASSSSEEATSISPDWSSLSIARGANLPHWTCAHAIYHVSFRLADAVPGSKRQEWLQEREEIVARAREMGRELSEEEENRLRHLYSEKIEQFLDAGHGDCWLKDPDIAKIVIDSLNRFDGERYRLHAWCVMPNHVHVIVEPLHDFELGKIVHSWKSFTANQANKALNRQGSFWQHEPYDHIIRSEREYHFQMRYVWENPEKAGVEAPRWVASKEVARASSSSGSNHLEQDARATSPKQEQDAPATFWEPAAGTFPDWPDSVAELRIMDPCMGSGHFLVAAFRLLATMRMDDEGLSPAEAARAVLRDNLYGLEIDYRCAQLAGFNLAMAAWKFAPELLQDPEPLPELHLACTGQAPMGTEDEWIEAVEARGSHGARFFLKQLYRTFQDAPVLGALINPRRVIQGNYDPQWVDELIALTNEALRDKDASMPDRYETGVVVHGIAKAAQLLAGRYHLVATNVPYLARGKQDERLKAFIEKYYPAGKGDIATALVLRIRELCAGGGTAALVNPQNWLFLKTYQKLREDLLRNLTWNWVARLGPRAFEEISGEVVNVALLILTRSTPGDGHQFAGIDVSDCPTPGEKAEGLRTREVKVVEQVQQLENPDVRITFESSVTKRLLEDFASNHQGLSTGDNPRFRRNFWELSDFGQQWEGEQSTVEVSELYGGRSGIILWQQGKGALYEFGRENVKTLHNVDRRGEEAWGKLGIAIAQMRELPATIFNGHKFDTNAAVVLPRKLSQLTAIWCFCSSPEFNRQVRTIDQKLNVTNATLVKVPFNLDYWQKIADQKYPNGLPEPYSNDLTQWLFKGRIDDVAGASSSSSKPTSSSRQEQDQEQDAPATSAKQDAPATLQVAVARLLGYRWPAETDPKKAGVEIFDSDRKHWEALEPFCDEDGIVCLTPLRGEESASSRLLKLLYAAYDTAHKHPYQLPANWREEDIPKVARPLDFRSADDWIRYLLNQAEKEDLESYLRDRFFEEHCQTFHQRPFIWHIWDGRKDGFHAFMNYHRLAGSANTADSKGAVNTGRKLLENLTYSYLGDWIQRQQDDYERDKPGAEARLLAAQQLQTELQNILTGEPPYDIFVRWKPIHEQPIGWDPDINDGVRLNIRPFMKAKDVKLKGAGILRVKPNINWKKDRGKEPHRPKEEYPWFWGWDEKTKDFAGGASFDGNRWNDCHYTNEFKRKRKRND